VTSSIELRKKPKLSADPLARASSKSRANQQKLLFVKGFTAGGEITRRRSQSSVRNRSFFWISL
jgi:hypothetical protein